MLSGLSGLFGGDDNNMLLIIIVLFFVLGGTDIFGGKDCHDHKHDRDCNCKDCKGGLFGGGNLIWILVLLFFVGDIF